jgi:hypothetical protein
MGKLIWNKSGLAEKINSPVSFITGANLKKKPQKKSERKPRRSSAS